MMDGLGSGQVLTAEVSVPGAGWPRETPLLEQFINVICGSS
jgi:hypothetical protein